MHERRRRAGILGTEGTACDVAWPAVFLASDEARWITGVALPVDAATTAITALPLDLLKLSPAVTRDFEADPLQGVVARAATQAGRVLGIPIVAKGADTTTALEALRAIGVDYAQGYALAPPRPIEDLIAEAGASCPIR